VPVDELDAGDALAIVEVAALLLEPDEAEGVLELGVVAAGDEPELELLEDPDDEPEEEVEV
jgi:hypothetical protein